MDRLWVQPETGSLGVTSNQFPEGDNNFVMISLTHLGFTGIQEAIMPAILAFPGNKSMT